MNASPVRSFGKYLLDEEIARGGMSRVFLARLRGLGGFEKRLIVKQVLPELASDPRFVEMFVQEAKTLVQMSHPHIAPVYELGVVDGVYFLAMEYVDGATLSQLLASGPVAPALVAHMGAQIGDALHYAHERFNIVHRDVTPRNVIVDAEGHARLLDFGIAAPVSDSESERGLFGTPGYLSPEQANGESLGSASDVFSLGAVLFEALTARRAFFARTVDETRAVLTFDGPDFYPADRVPDTLARIVDKALERDPAARFGSARELGRALRSWVATHAPEGVGPELGARVRDAKRPTPAEIEADAALDPVDPSEGEPEVRTLATNRVLDELLEEGTKGTEAVDDLGTKKIERASSPEEEESSTRPLARARPLDAPPRERAALADEELQENTGSAPVFERAEPAPERAVNEARATRTAREWRRRPQLVAAALVATALMAWIAWRASPRAVPEPEAALSVDETPPGEPPTDGQDSEIPPADHPPDLLGPDLPDPPGEPPSPPEEPPRQAAEPPSPPEEPSSQAEQRPRREAEVRGMATLRVNCDTWAEVSVDGRSIGRTPVSNHPVRAGRHTVQLSNPEAEVRRSFEVEAGQTVTLIGDMAAGVITIQ